MPKIAVALVLRFFCVAPSVLFIIFSVLLIFVPLMKQCENFILYLIFKINFKVNFKQN